MCPREYSLARRLMARVETGGPTRGCSGRQSRWPVLLRHHHWVPFVTKSEVGKLPLSETPEPIASFAPRVFFIDVVLSFHLNNDISAPTETGLKEFLVFNQGFFRRVLRSPGKLRLP